MSDWNALTPEQQAARLLRFFDRPAAGVRERVELDIRRHRMGWGTVVLTDGGGKPVKNREIRVRQKNHDFRFGCNLFKLKDYPDAERNAKYEAYFRRVFNEAVIPLLWDSTEPEPGRLRYAADSPHLDRRPPADLAVEWCEANGIAPKGHWLFCDNFVPRWLPGDSREVMYLLEKRIARLAERYGERIRKWDAVNESFTFRPRRDPAIGDAAVPPDYVYRVFKMAEKYLPFEDELLYNDGNGIFFEGFAYESSPVFLLADRLLRRGAKLDGLGLQFHMYGELKDLAERERRNYFDPAYLLLVMDQLGDALNLPLHMSEISLPTFPELPRELAEELQAQCLRNFYRTWFSQRNCGSIVYWNLCDKSAYGGESRFDAGLIGAGFEEKPAYRMLDALVNREWKTETVAVTDEFGEAAWNGFYGEYELEIAGEGHAVALTPRGEDRYRIRG